MAIVEPISADEAKLHARIDGTTDNDLVASLIAAARGYTEQFCRRKWVTASVIEKYDAFPEIIRPIYSPLITASITYLDLAGAEQTLSPSTYRVDTTTEPGRIAPIVGGSWPATASVWGAVTLTCTAGYGTDATGVPDTAKTAMKMLVAHWYRFRELASDVTLRPVPFAIESLLWQLRANW